MMENIVKLFITVNPNPKMSSLSKDVYDFYCSGSVNRMSDVARVVNFFCRELNNLFDKFYVNNSVFSQRDTYYLLEAIICDLYAFGVFAHHYLRRLFANGVTITDYDQLSLLIGFERCQTVALLESDVSDALVSEYVRTEAHRAEYSEYVEETFNISLLIEHL